MKKFIVFFIISLVTNYLVNSFLYWHFITFQEMFATYNNRLLTLLSILMVGLIAFIFNTNSEK